MQATCPFLEDNVLALLIAVFTLVSYLGYLHWWRLVPRLFYPEESKLEKQIAQLREEAERFNTTEQLHIHGRITRNVQLLMKRLALARKHRCVLHCCRNTSQTVNDTHRIAFLQNCYGFLCLNTPTAIGFFISFGFMIPMLCIYGNRPAVVVFSHCFRHCVPSPMKWADKVAMTVLLGPLLWASPSPGVDPDGALEGPSHKCLFLQGSNLSVSSSAMSDVEGRGVAMAAANAGEDELKSLGLVSWFLVCYIAVRLSHRVLSQR
ncbi:uncharacterized protein Tco025E_05097 [Trypanosoma conorhini]|uniref:Uncharacterized protein n=1 Tax=Trypanosoma conorhini TaxID=83891 RepID=A0A3R7P3L7_9TRYP|nr:uncharacterized protein Tco025E_05097 [Trypanosoma conorhini]RNF16718.1 hypothetical protein Tco025E_05097 [Trypanosoma conorhini]